MKSAMLTTSTVTTAEALAVPPPFGPGPAFSGVFMSLFARGDRVVTELDFVREGLNEGFKFQNPNMKDECGCGESFRV